MTKERFDSSAVELFLPQIIFSVRTERGWGGEMWHFPLWHFLNAPHCSQRNLPLLTFSLLIPVSSHCSQQCGCIQTAPPTNEEIHSNHLIIWPVVQQWVIYFMFPSATEQASEGHLTLGEGGRLEMTCWAWPQIKAHLIYHAFFLCFRSFLLPP